MDNGASTMELPASSSRGGAYFN